MFTVYRQDVYIGFTGCLALRTRNGRLKNSFNPGGTLPTHPVGPNIDIRDYVNVYVVSNIYGPKKWTRIDMRGLLKWPNTSFCYLLYITFWFTLHLGDTRQELPRVTLHLEDRKQFSSCMHLLGSCFNVLVSMLRKLGGT